MVSKKPDHYEMNHYNGDEQGPAEPEELAIDLDQITLSYGFRNKVRVLENLSLQLPRGNIYGLLGPSGCGKTSLIRCILGMAKVDSGSISVFGEKPGNPNSAIPGSGVGYMPQDISLYADLTIRETLKYFASLYGMSQKDCSKRSAFLMEFLNLPDKNQFVGKLSGGQKRRVSLATALIHMPPLLVRAHLQQEVDCIIIKFIPLDPRRTNRRSGSTSSQINLGTSYRTKSSRLFNSSNHHTLY